MSPPGGDKDHDDEDDYYTSATATPTIPEEDGAGFPTSNPFFSKKPYLHIPSSTQVTDGLTLPSYKTKSSAIDTWTTFTTSATPYRGALPSPQAADLSSLSSSYKATKPTKPGGGSDRGPEPGQGSGPPHGERHRLDSSSIYAAAIVTPIVVLAIIAAIIFFCMRKHKRQRRDTTAAGKSEEMKVRSQTPPTVQAYMASPLGAAPQYTLSNNQLLPPLNPALTQPIILGPISSGTNGAYFTGIDTSDAVSMTSANDIRPPQNPFSDNESLSEPPPPYRPRSVAPPSFTNSSRQSSLGAPNPLPETSQTHLIERSPFEDSNDDAISDLSGPTPGGSGDATSVVSDLSYQNDPIVNRPTLRQ